MDINNLIAIIKKKLINEIKIEKIEIEDKSFLHKNHKGNQKGKFHLKLIINSDELKKLTDNVWPEIRHLAELEMNSYEAQYPDGVVVLEAAVLFEAGWEDMGDEVWVIAVAPEIAIERACARDGLDRDAVQSRLDAQLSNDERVAKADVVIKNNGTQSEFVEYLEAAWNQLD